MQNRRCNTLVVDDDESILAILENMFCEAGMNVTTATSAEQALDVFALQPFDVVITDVQMGGMSGFDLLKRLRHIDSALKVVMMTSYNSYESVLQALQLGAYDYIQKPIKNHASVVAAVQRAYESTKLQQENLDLLVQLRASHDQLSAANKNLKEANRKLRRLAVTDGLTNLYNRRFFDQVIKREISRRNRYSLALTVVMIDIDNFKEFNDTYGHAGGDLAIKKVAEVLTATARITDVVARYGGEEFVVALPLTDPRRGITFAERVRRNIEKHIMEVSDTEKAAITLSIGIAGTTTADEPVSTTQLLRLADQALYTSKQQGKNQCNIKTIAGDVRKVA